MHEVDRLRIIKEMTAIINLVNFLDGTLPRSHGVEDAGSAQGRGRERLWRSGLQLLNEDRHNNA